MTEYKLRTWRGKDRIKVTIVTQDNRIYLSHLYPMLTDKLLRGSRPDPHAAIRTLLRKYPRKLLVVTDKLVEGGSKKEFEASMKAGFQKAGAWQG